jgi:hypothetical protein
LGLIKSYFEIDLKTPQYSGKQLLQFQWFLILLLSSMKIKTYLNII